MRGIVMWKCVFDSSKAVRGACTYWVCVCNWVRRGCVESLFSCARIMKEGLKRNIWQKWSIRYKNVLKKRENNFCASRCAKKVHFTILPGSVVWRWAPNEPWVSCRIVRFSFLYLATLAHFHDPSQAPKMKQSL